MIIVDQYHAIVDDINKDKIYSKLEKAARTCYKSEHKIDTSRTESFLQTLIRYGHESVLEHVNITVKFITDRGVSHELVRHRIASYSQESTRYCNYAKSNLVFIKPYFINQEKFAIWFSAMQYAAIAYKNMIEAGATPDEARSVLPTSIKTEIVMTANLREWRHILKLRTTKFAHPQIRSLMLNLLKEFKEKLPVIFSDIEV